MTVMPVLDTDGISGLLAKFVERRSHPAAGPSAGGVLVAIERDLFAGLAPEPGWGSELRRLLLAAGRRAGVRVQRHPDRSEELIVGDRVYYRGVSTGDADLEEVSLAIALAKWLLFRGGVEATEEHTVDLAMRLWLRAGGYVGSAPRGVTANGP